MSPSQSSSQPLQVSMNGGLAHGGQVVVQQEPAWPGVQSSTTPLQLSSKLSHRSLLGQKMFQRTLVSR